MDLDLDLTEVENLASGAEARSSKFNPRLQPRARPVRCRGPLLFDADVFTA